MIYHLPKYFFVLRNTGMMHESVRLLDSFFEKERHP